MPPQTNQRIDGKRLWDSLMGMAEIGATPKGGVRRLTLTDVDRHGRDRFRAECEAAGLTVRVDAIGNMFARRAGRDPSRLPVLFGSHLDSQPSGGKFDGALGVLAGLECIQAITETRTRHARPLVVAAWSDEEGRYGSLFGSRAFCGLLDPFADLRKPVLQLLHRVKNKYHTRQIWPKISLTQSTETTITWCAKPAKSRFRNFEF